MGPLDTLSHSVLALSHSMTNFSHSVLSGFEAVVPVPKVGGSVYSRTLLPGEGWEPIGKQGSGVEVGGDG